MLNVAKFAAGLLSVATISGCTMPMSGETKEDGIQVQTVHRLAALNTRLGVGYMRDGRNEAAYQKLTKALDIQPEYSGAHNALALLYEKLGKHQAAEKHYNAAIGFAPQDAKARNNFGSFLCRQDRVDEAKTQFDAAIANPLYQSPASAMVNAGLCMYRAKRVPLAEEYLRNALKQSPTEPSALLAMSELSITKGRELSARGYLQRYLERGKHNSRSLWLGVRIERVLGDHDAVSSYALSLKANYPDARETQLLLESEAQ
jgi:type IV pilus assembly protein PilF